jgi:hypothetical protein
MLCLSLKISPVYKPAEAVFEYLKQSNNPGTFKIAVSFYEGAIFFRNT